ncbi:MAG: molybdate ABC transporter substrate-binding protein [Bacteroidia bacterium]|nr:molybdate ABC transporter substrate-binding protein [Bacteroidia bacterium]
MNRLKLLIAGNFLLFLMACQPERPLLVAVAASLGPPMEEITAAFEAQTKIHVDISVAASGVHTAQITNGAPFNLFFSADMKYPQFLYEKGFSREEPIVFVIGELVFWSKDSVGEGDIIRYFSRPDLEKIAIANPEQAPFGRQALDWLTANGWDELLEGHLVYGENISHVNRYIFSGVVDAAFTSRSAMFDPNLKGKGYWLSIGSLAGEGIPHGRVVLKNRHRDINAFNNFLQTPEVAAIWEKYGYSIPARR